MTAAPDSTRPPAADPGARRRPIVLLAVLPAIPASVALGYLFFPAMEPVLRYSLSAIAWVLCFGPFFGWWWNSVANPLKAVGFFMGGILLRLMGLLGVAIAVYSRPENQVSVILFAIVIGTFLFFEVVSMTTFQIFTRKKV